MRSSAARNVAVFKALGGTGVYYGSDLGCIVARVLSFPYNVRCVSDPQYWGIVFTMWGLCLMLDASSIPIIETCWYVRSMQFLRYERGRTFLRKIMGDDIGNSL